ncbi:MAG: regulatory protein RecX [Nitrospirota bacterium]
MEERTLTKARNAAYRFLTYRPRSRAEIEAKLHDKEFGEAVIAAVLSDLERLGYVNDLQFAGAWTRSRIRLRGFGRRRIGQELKNKGIGPELIREVFSEVFSEETEIETAKRVAKKKLLTMKALDRETRRRRLAGLLERKGFSFEIIREVLKSTESFLPRMDTD